MVLLLLLFVVAYRYICLWSFLVAFYDLEITQAALWVDTCLKVGFFNWPWLPEAFSLVLLYYQELDSLYVNTISKCFIRLHNVFSSFPLGFFFLFCALLHCRNFHYQVGDNYYKDGNPTAKSYFLYERTSVWEVFEQNVDVGVSGGSVLYYIKLECDWCTCCEVVGPKVWQ